MYSEGQGVPQDFAEAGNWYRLSAEHGYAQAQYNLGLWYARAEGGSQDDVRAHMWFNLAAARFPPSDILSRSAAIKSRDTVASRMTTEQIAEAQRLAREWQPKP
jgi:TPR repeat protein